MTTGIPQISKLPEAAFTGIFLIGLGILFYTNTWWPGIILVLCAALISRQILDNRYFDSLITLFILGSIFSLHFFQMSWETLISILFIVGGSYIILREYLAKRKRKPRG